MKKQPRDYNLKKNYLGFPRSHNGKNIWDSDTSEVLTTLKLLEEAQDCISLLLTLNTRAGPVDYLK